MGKLTLITGGARSGKSSFAARLASKYGENVLFIATAVPLDSEMDERIKRHKADRPASWRTLEAYQNLAPEIEKHASGTNAILIDCATVMVNNLMYDKKIDWDTVEQHAIDEMENEIRREFTCLLAKIREMEIPGIIVTNELGMGIMPVSKMSRVFMDIHGRINQLLARAADDVYFCVAGIEMRIK